MVSSSTHSLVYLVFDGSSSATAKFPLILAVPVAHQAFMYSHHVRSLSFPIAGFLKCTALGFGSGFLFCGVLFVLDHLTARELKNR